MSTYKTLRESADRGRTERLARARGVRAAEERGDAKADARQDARTVASGVHKHERHDHPGTPLTKLRGGGKVEGRARGGRLDRGGGKKPVTVNVVVAGGGGQGHPVPVPVPGGMPPHPPIAGMGPGGPPPGAGMPPGAGGPPPGMMPPRKRGGAVKMTAGTLSGEGRMEKTRMVK